MAADTGYAAVDATHGHPALWTSPDGVAWEATRIGKASRRASTFELTEKPGVGYVMAGSVNKAPVLWRSADGETWTSVKAPVRGKKGHSVFVQDIAAGPAGFLLLITDHSSKATTTSLWTSPDGQTWQQVAEHDGELTAATAVGDGFLAMGPGVVLASPDGATWTATPEPLIDGFEVHALTVASDGRVIAAGYVQDGAEATQAAVWVGAPSEVPGQTEPASSPQAQESAAPEASGRSGYTAYRTYLLSLLIPGSGYWRVAESSAGSPAADEYGSHPGTYVNTPTMSATGALTGDADTGITLASASSQYVDVPGFNTASTPWTIGGWAKMTATGYTLLADYKDATGGLLLDFTGSGGNAKVVLCVNAGSLAGPGNAAVIDGNWHFYVGTYDGTVAELFMDGVSVAGPTAKAGPLVASGTNMRLGAYFNGEYFNGSIDELFATPQILTDAQIAGLFTRATDTGAQSITLSDSAASARLVGHNGPNAEDPARWCRRSWARARSSRSMAGPCHASPDGATTSALGRCQDAPVRKAQPG